MSVDWKFWENQSQYWKPKKGQQYSVVLSNWRDEITDFGGQSEPKKIVSFDVLRIGKEEFEKPLTWSTASRQLILDLKPSISSAEANNAKKISVLLKRDEDGRYSVFDAGALA